MPITRGRITLSGVKPIQVQKPGYQNFYLYGAVEPATGERFLLERDALNSDGFQDFLDAFSSAYSQSLNVLILDNGRFHKANKLTIPENVRLIFGSCWNLGEQPTARRDNPPKYLPLVNG